MMKYIFIIYLFGFINFVIFLRKLGQSQKIV
jgi:hypothetical protein